MKKNRQLIEPFNKQDYNRLVKTLNYLTLVAGLQIQTWCSGICGGGLRRAAAAASMQYGS